MTEHHEKRLTPVHPLLTRLVLLVLLLLCGWNPAVSWAAPTEANSKRLIIVTPERWFPALEEFIAHKRKLLPTDLRSLESILADTPGVDDPEKLKRFLFEQWRDHNLGYVLLVGDVDVLPVRYMVLDRITPAAFDYAFYPSDLYYADLAGPDGSFDDWNACKEGFHAGYFGEVRGEKNKEDPINYDEVDYRPEIAVGRWPVSTADQVKVVAARSVAYERSLTDAAGLHSPRAGFISVGGWVDSRPLMDELASKLSGAWKVEKRYYSDKRRPASTPSPDHERLRALLNGGLDLLVHAGHGQPNAWDQCFSMRDLDRVTNTACRPVIISAGCSTAYFAPLAPYDGYVDVNGKAHAGSDHHEVFKAPPPPPAPYQRDRFNPSGLGEQLLKHAPNGAVAYIGCNTGSQPCGLTLVDGFVTALAAADSPRLGDCWSSAIRFYFDKEHLAALKPTAGWYPPSIFFQGMKFMLFGDPSLRLPGPPIPSTVDLRPAFKKWSLPLRSQGGRGTCSVFALTGALEYALAHQQETGTVLSVEFLNWASNQATRNSNDGGFFSDLWAGYEEYGICPESELPYRKRYDSELQPDEKTLRKAKANLEAHLRLHWIKPWDVTTGMTGTEFLELRRTLASGWPVCGGFRWPKHEQWRKGVLQMASASKVFDGHSVLLVGFRDDPTEPGGGVFLIRNSGGGASDGAIPYEYVRTYLNDAAWIDAASAGEF